MTLPLPLMMMLGAGDDPVTLIPELDFALGAWVPTGAATLWECLETDDGDTTYALKSTIGASCRVQLSPAQQAIVLTRNINFVIVLAGHTGTGANVTMRFLNRDDSSVIASNPFGTPTVAPTYSTFRHALTQGEKNAVLDFEKIDVELVVGTLGNGVRVTYCAMEILGD